MNNSIVRLLWLACVPLLLNCSSKKEERSNTFAVETIAVRTAKIKTETRMSSVSATGLITTENEARCGFKIGGVIDRIYVNEGQSFSRGQLLASLKLNEIDAGLAQANLGLEKSKRDYQRISNLYKDSVATLEQLQNTKTVFDLAQKQLDAVSFNKQFAFIYARSSGFVTKKIANEGEVIEGGKPVLLINENDNSRAWVIRVGLSDKEWVQVSVGAKAKVNIDAFSNEQFQAVVTKKLLAADQISGTFQLELKLEPHIEKLAIGMYGKAVIDTDNKFNYPSIPYSALIEADGNKGFVFVPINQSQVKKLPVTIYSFNNKEVVIASGLDNVKEIVVSNSAFLNERSRITIEK